MSGDRWWCDFCQDYYDVDHDVLGTDGEWSHGSGIEYGPAGYHLALADGVDALLDATTDEDAAAAHDRLLDLRAAWRAQWETA